MYEVTTQEIVYYAAVYAIAFSVAVARSYRDADAGSVVRGISYGFTAGFLSFGIVSVGISFGGGGAGTSGVYWAGLGASALIGWLGKEQDKLYRATVTWFLKKRGIDVDAIIKEVDKKDDKP